MTKKILIRFLLVVLVLLLLLLILAPGIARRYAVKNSKELIGRQIELKKLKVNYFTGKVQILEFCMFEEDGFTEFVTFDTLILKLKPFQLFVDEFVMERFYLRGLDVHLIQVDSSFNFDDLLAFHSSSDTLPVPDTTNEDPFRFQLSDIELKHATIDFEDRNIYKTTSLRDVSFFIPFIGWNQEDKSEAGLRFAFKNEGYFESSINVHPIDGEFEAEVKIHHLYLDAFKEYTTDYLNINSLAGKFNAVVQIDGNIYEPEKSILSGQTEVIGFELTDLSDKKFIAAEQIRAAIKEVNVFEMVYIVDSLVLISPYLYFELDTASNNLYEAFKIEVTEEDSMIVKTSVSEDSVAGPSIYYAVNELKIQEGIIDYTDNLTGEPFSYYLDEITLETDSIESTADWIELNAGMKLNHRGALKAEVGLDPFNPMDIQLNYVVTDFQLADLNIYSRFYMGFPIVYGDMYYQSETSIRAGNLESQNKLIINNVELGEKSGGLYDLPLKFALFLLKDRNGVITLDVPVRGDLNDPTITYGKIIWNTFKNLIIKVAASPFDFLAGLISVDPGDIQSIEFDYTDTTLTDRHKEQLEMLLEIEGKKEGLKIELVYFNDVVLEQQAIAANRVAEDFQDETSMDAEEKTEEFAQYVYNRLGTDTLVLEEACYILLKDQLSDTITDFLRDKRKYQVDNYLASVNDSTTISSRFSNPGTPKNTGSRPVFEVKYTMQQQETDEDNNN